ncbi:hypothetical protein BDN70DRAFT_888064 [Pholiota conissans]|uniref:Uncharacterized protein n=1 Tax=Pholiota conissans TaxID=109636 RepID=A0A9P5YPV0_9AGAR|nr:hypothetical protein BDN70DRAFT_888064 [Pholiota conissans]
MIETKNRRLALRWNPLTSVAAFNWTVTCLTQGIDEKHTMPMDICDKYVDDDEHERTIQAEAAAVIRSRKAAGRR